MSKPPADEKTWSVLLYRKEIGGWKKQEFSTSSLNRHRHAPTLRMTTVAPRIDCIVFPELRQKFSLKSEADRGTVIRRDNKILLVSKRRARALLLEFPSLEDCLGFSDQFVRLNPRKPLVPLSKKNKNGKKRKTPPAVVGEKEQREVVSWIVKMLHDKSFLSFVHKIENYIAETEDGKQILKGLEQADLSSP